MATLKQRLHRLNSSGTYDVVHLETSADLVLRSDGTTTVESSISSLESAIENVGGSKKFYGTIGTTWTEDADTGAKIQEVSIPGIVE